jgi:hypothetical protein
VAVLSLSVNNASHGRCGRLRRILLAALILVLPVLARAAERAPILPEYQVKAVFLFNFAQFVEWPAVAFPEAKTPLVIGVLGEDPFGAELDEIVRGETLGLRPLQVRRYQRVEEIEACHILFISRSEGPRLALVLERLKGRSVLTVGDMDEFTRRGGMIRFVTEQNKVRMRINVEAAKRVGLVISSKLLRPADIVTEGSK